jgi:hypothetical protein
MIQWDLQEAAAALAARAESPMNEQISDIDFVIQVDHGVLSGSCQL